MTIIVLQVLNVAEPTIYFVYQLVQNHKNSYLISTAKRLTMIQFRAFVMPYMQPVLIFFSVNVKKKDKKKKHMNKKRSLCLIPFSFHDTRTKEIGTGWRLQLQGVFFFVNGIVSHIKAEALHGPFGCYFRKNNAWCILFCVDNYWNVSIILKILWYYAYCSIGKLLQISDLLILNLCVSNFPSYSFFSVIVHFLTKTYPRITEVQISMTFSVGFGPALKCFV